MTAPILVDPSLEVSADRLLAFVAEHYIPGERVRLARGVRFSGETDEQAARRMAPFGDGVVTVSELRVDATADGPRLHYRFDGVEGLHNAKAFEGPEGFLQRYGALVGREGETWFVPLSTSGEAAVDGEAMRVAPEMTRCGHYHFGLPDETLAAFGHIQHEGRGTVEAFLSEHESEPTVGEYALAPLADGTWRLDASPWMAPADACEVSLAEEAIAAARLQAGGPRP